MSIPSGSDLALLYWMLRSRSSIAIEDRNRSIRLPAVFHGVLLKDKGIVSWVLTIHGLHVGDSSEEIREFHIGIYSLPTL